MNVTRKDVRRTRVGLAFGRWFLIIGLTFYSLMTTTPLVSAHSEWAWSGFALGLIVDAAFIMALSAEGTLAKFGMTELGRWAWGFRWFTGLSSLFLNTWGSIERKDWVGVAIHAIAPALVMILAEVGPVFMKHLADAERMADEPEKATTDDPAEAMLKTVVGSNPINARFLNELEPYDETEKSHAEAPVTGPGFTGVAKVSLMDVPKLPLTFAADEPAAEEAPKRLNKADAHRVIESGFNAGMTAKEVAVQATRHPNHVARVFRELAATA